ncbi:MAG: histidine kinase [Lysobacter sp.]
MAAERLPCAVTGRYHRLMISWRALLVLPPMLLACALWSLAGRSHDVPAVELLQADMSMASAQTDPAALSPSDWQPLDQQHLAGRHGPLWLRWRFRVGPDADARPLGMTVSLRAASEVYWDGKLLGRNGRVGDSRQSEVAGGIDWFTPLPGDAVDAGMHELVVRASAYHLDFEPYMAGVYASIAPVDDLFSRRYGPWLVAAVAMGFIALAWLYFSLVLWRTRRQPSAGAISLLGIGMVGLLLPMAEAWRPLLGYAYDLHVPRLVLILGLTVLAASLLPRYIAARFAIDVPVVTKTIFVLVLLGGALLVPSFDGKSLFVHLAGLLAAFWLAWRALRTGHRDAAGIVVLVLATLALLVTVPVAFLDGLYFIALAVLMVFLLLRHADHVLALGERSATLEAQRTRLRAQLLRNSIHPHWLMNTLTSLQELIDQAPAKASRMVDLLASEFRLLRQIDDQSVIALDTEIELCRAHLDIVATAHDTPIAFTVEGSTDGIEVPPGVLHTLVENGLTHAGVPACAREGFALVIKRTEGAVELQLRSALGRGPAAHDGVGTGTRFIEASLQAAFARGGSFQQHAVDGAWLSRLGLPCGS